MGGWEFATAGRIVFGVGASAGLAGLVSEFGRRPLLVTGRTCRVAFEGVARMVVEGEPTVEMVRAGAVLGREAGCDCVVACGGGSALDAGKAVAALLTNDGDVLDYLEVVGAGRALERSAAPVVAVPTTAGTGSEVTKNAVLGSKEHGVKASLRHGSMIPRVAVVDPALAVTLPREESAATGLDALTQLIEPFLSVRANAMTDALCVDGIAAAWWWLPRVLQDGTDLEARTAMARASLFGGMALANAGLGAVHGFAAPLGGLFPAPHGAACAAVLAPALQVNLEALRARAPESPALAKMGHLAGMLTGEPRAEILVEALKKFVEAAGVRGLRAFGVSEGDEERVCEKAARASSMKANPIVLTREELGAIFRGAL